MPAYVIARIRVKDDLAYEEYRRMVAPIVQKHGGRFLARGGRAEWLEPEERAGLDPGRIIVLEFPSYEKALAWHRSEDYVPALRKRQASSEGELILAEGLT